MLAGNGVESQGLLAEDEQVGLFVYAQEGVCPVHRTAWLVAHPLRMLADGAAHFDGLLHHLVDPCRVVVDAHGVAVEAAQLRCDASSDEKDGRKDGSCLLHVLFVSVDGLGREPKFSRILLHNSPI